MAFDPILVLPGAVVDETFARTKRAALCEQCRPPDGADVHAASPIAEVIDEVTAVLKNLDDGEVHMHSYSAIEQEISRRCVKRRVAGDVLSLFADIDRVHLLLYPTLSAACALGYLQRNGQETKTVTRVEFCETIDSGVREFANGVRHVLPNLLASVCREAVGDRFVRYTFDFTSPCS